MPDYVLLTQTAREAVAQACSVCRQVQAALGEVRAIVKDDKSPVTVADFASQAIVAHVLAGALGGTTGGGGGALGGLALVAEEDSGFLRDDEHRPHLEATLSAVREVWPECDEAQLLEAIDLGTGESRHSGFWTLDPIDGTKGFLRGQQYAVSLAYIEYGQPVVGVLGCPNLATDFNRPMDEPDDIGCMYFCIRGDGLSEIALDDAFGDATAVMRLDHERGEPITVCSSVEKAHSSVSDMDRILAHVGEPSEPIRLDSQAKYAVVARGQADAYLRLPTRKDYVERIWDHAAGSLIASEAGCFVTDIFGHALDFSHGRGLEKNTGVVCAPPRVHGLLLGAIEALGIGR